VSTRPLFRPRAAFSLVELLVALSVLTLGLLALASVGAGVVRASSAAARSARAARLLEARAESLHVAPCDTGSGTADVDGLRESWRVQRDGDLLALADTVRLSLPGHLERSSSVAAWRWCGR
jgi:prepilin-type N-terminal cleavage/methylation domain-containing protein